MTTMASAASGLRRQLDTLRASPAYRNYVLVKDHVLRLKTLESTTAAGDAPSAYWREELDNIRYMLDASPLIVDQLRRHTQHVTGLRVHDYRSNRDGARARFADKLEALIAEGDEALLVPEPRALGGFGFEIGGSLYNLDTLKFYEVLIALDRGSVLAGVRAREDRALVWEIGAGWGGFPYVFKTLCPNVTYVITDLPELFMFSATYLLSLFPDARVRFYGEVPPEETFDEWRDLDFIFIPAGVHATLRPERVDLTINMVSFQEMTDRQVEGYVRRAWELECPFLYSLNRDRSGYNDELTSVHAILSRFYWPHEHRVLPMGYTKMLDDEPDRPEREYKHVVGWRRLQPTAP